MKQAACVLPDRHYQGRLIGRKVSLGSQGLPRGGRERGSRALVRSLMTAPHEEPDGGIALDAHVLDSSLRSVSLT